jgi:hypothetical protein
MILKAHGEIAQVLSSNTQNLGYEFCSYTCASVDDLHQRRIFVVKNLVIST